MAKRSPRKAAKTTRKKAPAVRKKAAARSTRTTKKTTKKKTAKKPASDRTSNGTFASGNTASMGNKGGRPTSAVVQARNEFFTTHSEQAKQVLAEALDMKNRVPWRERLRAAEIVVSYIYGRPTQRVEVESNYLAVRQDIDEAEAEFVRQAAKV